MIQIVPVENKKSVSKWTDDFFKGQEHFYKMEMQDGSRVMGSGTIFVKGDVAYLLEVMIHDQTAEYMIFDSLIRSLMNLASHQGAIIFNANELYPLMGYFKKHEFDRIQKFTCFEKDKEYEYYVAIEPFFARPCKG